MCQLFFIMKKIKKRYKKLQNKINRQNAIEQGFYDGRFRNKIVPNKKKKENKEGKKNYKIED